MSPSLSILARVQRKNLAMRQGTLQSRWPAALINVGLSLVPFLLFVGGGRQISETCDGLLGGVLAVLLPAPLPRGRQTEGSFSARNEKT